MSFLRQLCSSHRLLQAGVVCGLLFSVMKASAQGQVIPGSSGYQTGITTNEKLLRHNVPTASANGFVSNIEYESLDAQWSVTWNAVTAGEEWFDQNFLVNYALYEYQPDDSYNLIYFGGSTSVDIKRLESGLYSYYVAVCVVDPVALNGEAASVANSNCYVETLQTSPSVNRDVAITRDVYLWSPLHNTEQGNASQLDTDVKPYGFPEFGLSIKRSESEGSYTIYRIFCYWGCPDRSLYEGQYQVDENGVPQDIIWELVQQGNEGLYEVTGKPPGTYFYKLVEENIVSSERGLIAYMKSSAIRSISVVAKPELIAPMVSTDGNYTLKWRANQNLVDGQASTPMVLEELQSDGTWSVLSHTHFDAVNGYYEREFIGVSPGEYGYRLKVEHSECSTSASRQLALINQLSINTSVCNTPLTDEKMVLVSANTTNSNYFSDDGFYKIFLNTDDDTLNVVYYGLDMTGSIPVNFSDGLYTTYTVVCTAGACSVGSYSTFSHKTTHVGYQYDALGRLIDVDWSTGQDRVYEYDAAGNRLEVISDNTTVISLPTPSPSTSPLRVTSCPQSEPGVDPEDGVCVTYEYVGDIAIRIGES